MNLENPKVKQAFIRGFTKRAAEAGLEKSAILPLLLGGLGTIGGAIGADMLAARTIVPKILSWAGTGANDATRIGKLKNWLSSPAYKNLPRGARGYTNAHSTILPLAQLGGTGLGGAIGGGVGSLLEGKQENPQNLNYEQGYQA
jgi:hypothetical protein